MMNTIFFIIILKSARNRWKHLLQFSGSIGRSDASVPAHWRQPPPVRVRPGRTGQRRTWTIWPIRTRAWGWSESGTVWVPSSSSCAASVGSPDGRTEGVFVFKLSEGEKKNESKRKVWFCSSHQTARFCKEVRSWHILEFHFQRSSILRKQSHWNSVKRIQLSLMISDAIWPIKVVC